MSTENPWPTPADWNHVALTDRAEVGYWTRRFDCTEEQLRAAIEAVGNVAADVERWLREQVW